MSERPRPLIVSYHLGGLPASVLARADHIAKAGTPFKQQYSREGSGVVRPFSELGEGKRPIILAAWSEGVQAIRSHIRDGRALSSGRLLGVVALDGAHASDPPDDRAHLQPWRELSRWGRPWVLTSSRVQTPPGVLSTRDVVRRLGWPDDDGEHRLGAGRLLLTGGAGASEHVKHAQMGAPEIVRILDAYDRGELDGGGVGSVAVVAGAVLAVAWAAKRWIGGGSWLS